MAVIEVGGGAAAGTMTKDAPGEMMTIIIAIPDLQDTIAITDLGEDDPNVTRMTDVIETGSAVVRQVPENGSRARHRNHNLLRMSVTGEPFLSNNLLLVSAPKS
jgi:hypothetical protein